jgi:hypothetical protein
VEFRCLKKEPIYVPMPFGSIEIDTSKSLEECVGQVLDFLQQ